MVVDSSLEHSSKARIQRQYTKHGSHRTLSLRLLKPKLLITISFRTHSRIASHPNKKEVRFGIIYAMNPLTLAILTAFSTALLVGCNNAFTLVSNTSSKPVLAFVNNVSNRPANLARFIAIFLAAIDLFSCASLSFSSLLLLSSCVNTGILFLALQTARSPCSSSKSRGPGAIEFQNCLKNSLVEACNETNDFCTASGSVFKSLADLRLTEREPRLESIRDNDFSVPLEFG